MKHGGTRTIGWLLVLAGSILAGGCGPELRPEDTATRSLAPRGTYDKLYPTAREWSGDAPTTTTPPVKPNG